VVEQVFPIKKVPSTQEVQVSAEVEQVAQLAVAEQESQTELLLHIPVGHGLTQV
jgi:hypothetical protein